MNIFSQDSIQKELIGNWQVKDIKINDMPIISCNPKSTPSDFVDLLKKQYLNASFVLYTNNRIIYFSNRSDNSTYNKPLVFTELINYKWKVLDDGKIELLDLRYNKQQSTVSLKYEEGKLNINLFGIEMITEKK